MFKKPQFDFLGKRKIAFVISLVLVIGSFVLMFVKKSDLLAVDLSGGTVAIYDYKIAAPSQKVADVSEEKPYICNPTPSQSVRKWRFTACEKMAPRLTAISLPECCRYLITGANIQTYFGTCVDWW